MFTLKVSYVKSHEIQLPFLSSSEPFLRVDVDLAYKLYLLGKVFSRSFQRVPLQFSSLFFCSHPVLKHKKHGKVGMETNVKFISKYL